MNAEQAMFNALLQINPDLAEEIRGTDADPFYDDDRIAAFLDAFGPEERTPEIPAGLQEALKWAEKLQGISIETGGTLIFTDDADDIDRCWEWIDRLVRQRLQLAQDVAARRKVACRFAAGITGPEDADYSISGRAGASDEEMLIAATEFLKYTGESQSFGTVYLALPVAEEVEAETDE